MSGVSAALRVDRRDLTHTHVSVFVGSEPGLRAHSGTLVFRTQDWEAMVEHGAIVVQGRPGLMLRFDVLEPLGGAR